MAAPRSLQLRAPCAVQRPDQLQYRVATACPPATRADRGPVPSQRNVHQDSARPAPSHPRNQARRLCHPCGVIRGCGRGGSRRDAPRAIPVGTPQSSRIVRPAARVETPLVCTCPRARAAACTDAATWRPCLACPIAIPLARQVQPASLQRGLVVRPPSPTPAALECPAREGAARPAVDVRRLRAATAASDGLR